MPSLKFNIVNVKGDFPFIYTYHLFADRFFTTEEKNEISKMKEEDFLEFVNVNNWNAIKK